MKINNKSMRTFAIFASFMMLTVIAVPMVAAENVNDYDVTESTNTIKYEELNELMYEFKEIVESHNEAVVIGDYKAQAKYVEEIDEIIKEFESHGVEVEKLLLLDVVIHYEKEELCEKINELIYELKETVTAYNEATKQGDTNAQAEYFKKIGELVSELQALGINIEITGNPVITFIILGITVSVAITKKTVISYLAAKVVAIATTHGFIMLLERGGDICRGCEFWIRAGGFTLSTAWSYIVGKYGVGTLANILSTTPWRLIGCLAGFTARAIPACNNPNCMLHRHRR